MSLLSIEHVYKQYDKDNYALIDFSLQIAKGSILSLVGESGSGKSTLLRIIAGLEVQDAGQVYFHNDRILNPSQKLVPGYEEIQLIHQQHELYPHSTVEQNIARPLLVFDKKYKEERIASVLELLNLTPHRHKFPRELSGGQQQKVAIGRALSIEPEVLLLDEPFSSLDNIQKRELIGELKLIFLQLEVTVLLVTHDIEDAMSMSDQLCIIQRGEIIQMGRAQDICEQPENYYVAKLLSELNPIPGQGDAFVRPSDLTLDEEFTGINGTVEVAQYLVAHNQLTVLIEGTTSVWKVEDRARKYSVGDSIHLSWDPSKVLYLKKSE